MRLQLRVAPVSCILLTIACAGTTAGGAQKPPAPSKPEVATPAASAPPSLVPGLTACYENFLRNTNKKGRTVLQLTILPDGTVDGAKVVETTIDDAEATACVVDRALKWKTTFHPPEPRALRYVINLE